MLYYAFDYLDLNWKNYVDIDKSLIRRNNNIDLIADSSKINKDLSWKPLKNFRQVLERMIKEDMEYKKIVCSTNKK